MTLCCGNMLALSWDSGGSYLSSSTRDEGSVEVLQHLLYSGDLLHLCPECVKKCRHHQYEIIINPGRRKMFWIKGRACASKTIASDCTNKHRLSFIVLVTLNFMREDYFPWEQIVLSISILIFSLEQAFVHHLCKTKLLNFPPLSSFPNFKKENYNVQDTQLTVKQKKFSSVPRQEYDTEDETVAESYSERAAPCQFHSYSYHQRRNVKFNKDLLNFLWLESNCREQRWKPRAVPPPSNTLHQAFQTTLFMLLVLSSVLHGTQGMANTSHMSVPVVMNISDNNYNASHHEELFCSHHSLQELSGGAGTLHCSLENCECKQDSDCCNSNACIKDRDKQAKEQVDQFERVMLKYATAETYSVQWPMDSCKTAYRDWVCSEYHKVYVDGVPVTASCLSLCMKVEASCPFFRVYNKTKLYGGQPTFLCQETFNQTSKDDCATSSVSAVLTPKHLHADETKGFYGSEITSSLSKNEEMTTQASTPLQSTQTVKMKNATSTAGSPKPDYFNTIFAILLLFLLRYTI